MYENISFSYLCPGMWHKFISTGKEFLTRGGNFIRRKNYNETVVTSILTWTPYIVGSVATALVAILYAKIFDYINYFSHIIKDHIAWLFFIITPICLLLGWLIIRKVSPAASGSGIPQLMAALDPKRDPKKVSTGFLLGGRSLIAKFTSSIVALLGGAVIGREGPMIQISASIFYIVHKFIPKEWPRIDRGRMLIAGGAAGLAAAFNTPLGGIVFAIEELSHTHLNAFKSSLLYAVIFSGMTVQWILGPYLFLGFPKVESVGFSMIGYVILFSFITGVAGAYKGKLILQLIYLKRKLKKPALQVLWVGLSGVVLAFLFYFNRDTAFGPGKDIMTQILFNTTDHEISGWLLLSRYFGAIISYTSGIAGGVFATSLSSGSIIGELLMNLMNLDQENKLLILVAMIGFLTGMTRAPFTTSILVLEMTDRHSAIFMFILAGLISSVAARIVDKKSLYQRLEWIYLR
ncbi:MAG: chloride channel protein [Bacteroidetes bacterium]|nr:MAG: chloride channel protein [Bacteroidota bacterium]